MKFRKFTFSTPPHEYIDFDIEIGEKYLCIQDYEIYSGLINKNISVTNGKFYKIFNYTEFMIGVLDNNGVGAAFFPDNFQDIFDISITQRKDRSNKIDTILDI